jgi:signal transduction histidine kinase
MYSLNVLAVDDEPHMRTGMVRSLSNFKFKVNDIDDEICFVVDTAESGEEGLEKINQSKPDILLLDYKLPGITGLEVLEQIDSNDENMVTIMITAFASLETAVSAIKSGAFDFLAKPFTPQELRNKITKAAQSLILARQVKKLNEEKKQVRFQFISVLGHELKAPLSAVEGYLYMFKDRALGEDLTPYNQMMERCLIRTDQMRKLIADLLEMTKIESGNRQRDIKELDLSEVTTMSIETMIPDAQRREIKINFIPTPVLFMADRVEMEIVMNNLVSNAVKYNRDGGEVFINIEENEELVSISVRDTGIGMTKEECDKLFRDFVRIKNSKTKDIIGSGLGLSTVKKIATIYGGDAIVESEENIGTKFTVTMKKTIMKIN